MGKTAIIIGAGPAGLTAAYELLKRTDIKPIILEKSGAIGGLSQTVVYNGNRMDMGPHRFFSKSDRVMDWWQNIMPLHANGGELTINYHNQSHTIKSQEQEDGRQEAEKEQVPTGKMMVIKRLTRIYFLRKLFAYPISLSIDTLRKLGLTRTIGIMWSYILARVQQRKPEKSLEDFLINRFGKKLYLLFFKDYTEKVWGTSCHEIPAEWGAQRIKGVSISKAIAHAIRKTNETSLVEQFLYPPLGAGQMWEEVARRVEIMGGQILHHCDITTIQTTENAITAVTVTNSISGATETYEGDYFFSTMPVRELVAGMGDVVPDDVKSIAAGLQYRDFVNVGVLLNQLVLPLADNWLYIQDRDVKVGRVQVYNNWGPYMVKDPDTTWIGMEYFCNKEDDFWALDDLHIKCIAIDELEKIGLATREDVLDLTVRRMEKTYPAYFGAYAQFDSIRAYVDRFENLFLVGRNGMHKYNNTDHSMLTAMTAVDNICEGITTKTNIWEINTEQEYHEVKKEAPVQEPAQSLPKGATAAPAGTLSFKAFVFKRHKRLTIATLAILVIQFVLFKFLYPYPNFMPDSYSYLDAATKNMDINMWPIGYSKFLRIFSAFTHSDTALIGFQYLFLQASVLCFIFTLWYFLQPGKLARWIMSAFFVFNPAFLYISNYISADALFIGVSVLWMVHLLWIIYRPQQRLIYTHALVLFMAFILRYNALFYPFISAIVILTSSQSRRTKLVSNVLSFLLLSLFFWHNGNQYEAISGRRQFSAFGGWQLAANALFMYSHTYKETPAPPTQFAALDKMVRTHIDSLSKLKRRPDSTVNIYYLWNGPLREYLSTKTKKDSTVYFDKWASISPFYSDYARWLIRQHPIGFFKYYLWPNTIRYYVPEVEFLGEYNMRQRLIEKQAKTWFGYKTNQVKGYRKELRLFNYYPITLAVINVVFAAGLLGFILLSGFKDQRGRLSPALWIMLNVWVINLGFSVFASPIVLRYQLFPMVLAFSFSTLLIEYVYRKAMARV